MKLFDEIGHELIRRYGQNIPRDVKVFISRQDFVEAKLEFQPSEQPLLVQLTGVPLVTTRFLNPGEFRYSLAFCDDICCYMYRAQQAGYENLLEIRQCNTCGNDYKARKRNNRYCSRECFELAHKENMRGESNPSYIDGRSYKSTYNAGSEWHEIRVEVYKRDDYTCQSCGIKCVSKSTTMQYPNLSTRIIQCHHIEPYAMSQDNSLDNLITLCISCHRSIHNATIE
jgi:5-methylcytosine-specific restriction endonuclease McrA